MKLALELARDMGQFVKEVGVERAESKLNALMESGPGKTPRVKPSDFSIRTLFEELIPDGPELISQMNSGRKSGGLFESVGAVDSSAFLAISGQVLFNAVMQAYENPAFLAPSLTSIFSSKIEGEEKIPGISIPKGPDGGVVIGHGQVYPELDIAQEWVSAPGESKHGYILNMTREAILYDKTGLLLNHAQRMGEILAEEREALVMDLVWGVTNNYKYKDVALNTYQATKTAATPWVNTATNTLVDYTDINVVEAAFAAMTDPLTERPILVSGNTMLVGRALVPTARRIVNATQIAQGDITSGSGLQTWSATPINGAYSVLSNAYCTDTRTDTGAHWLMGDFPRAFGWKEIWGLEKEYAIKGNEAEFTRDIWFRMRAGYNGQPFVLDPRFVYLSTN